METGLIYSQAQCWNSEKETKGLNQVHRAANERSWDSQEGKVGYDVPKPLILS